MSGIYRTEGPLLEEEAHLYVERPEDRKVASAVRGGSYVTLVGARQTGKTSLLLRLRRQLLKQGHVPIYLDPSPARDRDRDAWYRYLQGLLQGQLEREDGDLTVPPMRDHVDFREVLRQISRQLSESRKVVVLLDEVNAVPSDISDYFFSTIRTVFNEREPFPAFRRYVFVMAGAFVPDRLVENRDISPFNIAKRFYTSDASREKLIGLVKNLERAECSVSEKVLERIYRWTEGHVYLTQRLCAALERMADGDLTPQHVDTAVDALMSDQNIEHIYGKLEEIPEVGELLERIMAGDRPLRFSRASALVPELELIGVIKEGTDGCCRIRNAIYRKALADRYEGLSADGAGEMTKLENKLFQYFCQNTNRTCTKYDIAKAVWGEDSYWDRSIEDRIYQLVARLRDKLASDPASNLEIVTRRGRGYMPRRRE